MTEKRPVVAVELGLGGTSPWTDISNYTRLAPGTEQIAITRGAQNEATTADPSGCTLVLNNGDGRFTPRNPSGPYYGQLRRNTPLRVRVPAGGNALVCRGEAASNASTPDNAVLDIAQDLDLRVEFVIDSWGVTAGLVSKGAVGSSLAYQLLVGFTNGVPHLTWRWSANGTTTRFVDHDLLELAPGVPIAVRVTHQGAAGDIKFYTAPTIAGPFTQHGTTTHLAPVLSIFNSADGLFVGTRSGGSDPFLGAVRAVELRNGVNGTVVANPVFSAQTPGAGSFADGAGRTWTVNAGAALGAEYTTRFIGEVSAWPQSWSPVGTDVRCTVQAAGVLRRLGQGQAPTQSGPKTFITGKRFGQCWQGDVNASLSRLATPLVLNNCAPFVHFGQGQFGDGYPVGMLIDKTNVVTGNIFPQSGYIEGYLGSGTGGTFEAAGFVFQSDNLGSMAFYLRAYGALYPGGYVILFDSVTQSADIYKITFDPDNGYQASPLATSGTGKSFYTDGQIHSVLWTITVGGGQLIHTLYLDGVAISSPVGTDTLTSLQGMSTFVLTYDPTLNPDATAVNLSFITTWSDQFGDQTLPDPATWSLVSHGYSGEPAGRRIQRVCQENGVPFVAVGDLDNTALMGPQGSGDLISLLQGAAETDLGILHEPRGALGLAYRTRASMYNQAADLTLDYTAAVLGAPPDVTDDDQAVRNDVTVSRTGGGSARDTLTSGALSILSPPNGIGQYATSATLNLLSDGQLPDHASWRLALGTVDEARLPSLPISMMNPAVANVAVMRAAALAVDVGDKILLTHPPAWLPPDNIGQLAQGYSETIAIDGWDLGLNTSPASPYDIGVYGTDRYDAEFSLVAVAFNTSATSLSIEHSSDTQRWTTDAAAFPFDINIGGERMTVTNITGTGSPQTFTVTRSINGVVKAHAVGEAVHLWNRARYAL